MIGQAKRIFGSAFEDIESAIYVMAESLDISRAVSNVLTEMITLGIENADIANILNNIPAEEWGNVNAEGILHSIVGNMMSGLFSTDEWEEIDVEAEKAMYSLLKTGTAANEIKKAFDETHNIEEFKERLAELNAVVADGVDSEGGETGGKIEKYSDSISKLYAEMEKAQSMADTLKEGKTVTFNDLMDLTEAHPEILQTLTDLDALKKKLQEIADEDKKASENKLKEWASSQEGSAGVFNGWIMQHQGLTGFPTVSDEWNYMVASVSTIQELRDLAEEKGNNEMLNAIDSYLTSIIVNAKQAYQDLKAVEEITEAQKAKEGLEKSQKLNEALTGIDTTNANYDPLKAFDYYDVLEEEYAELRMLEKGSSEYFERAKELVDQTTVAAEEAASAFVRVHEEIDKAQAAIDGLTNSQNLRDALNAINPSSGKYDAKSAIEAFTLLEKEYPALLEYERGSQSYMEMASIYVSNTEAAAREAAAELGVVDGLTAKILGYTNKTDFSSFKDNNYEGAFDYLKQAYEDAMTEAGEGGVDAYNQALQELDDAGILEGMVQQFGDISTIAEEAAGNIDYIDERFNQLRRDAEDQALSDLAKKIEEERGYNRSASEGYVRERGQLSRAIDTGDAEAISQVWNSFDDTIQKGIEETYPRLVEAINDVNKAAKKTANDGVEDLENSSQDTQKAMNELRSELDKVTKSTNSKYFDNTEKAITGLRNGTMSLGDAYAQLNGDIKSADKAIEQYNNGVATMAAGTELAESDVNALASYLGDLDPQWILDNWSQVGPMLSAALAEGEDAFRRLNEAAFINITGTSEADFSAIQNGIISTMNLTEEMLELLLQTGQWTIEEMPLNTEAWVNRGSADNPNWVLEHLTGLQQILKPTGNNPLGGRRSNLGRGGTAKKASGGGGGGGGGKKKSDSPSSSSSGSSNQQSEVERMLDVMEQIQKLQTYTKDMYSAMAKYYEQTGELQGVIAYYELERKAIADQNATLEANVKDIEAQMKAKQAEAAVMSTADEAYEQVASDLDKLQTTYQNYTKQIISNRTEMDALTKAIKKQQDAIRQMEIDIREEIYQAIEDREALIERKLQGRIELENEILDLIQKRYEKERDEILENAQMQIDALEQERDLLSEQLELRKEQAEEEDKLKQLAELEAQYQRIVADPTRRKEALKIQEQIEELREEMAWDLAEKEVEAQQKSIDEQITSIEDYMEYVEQYYEDMFEHPKKLIAEMESIITQTDDYIIDWLKSNSEEYANATEATQTNMVNNWEQMLLDMHGDIKTYWDEVEDIISQGDEAILKFLVENSANYKKAGKLQASAYVDAWMEQLYNLQQAHKAVTASLVNQTMQVINAFTGSKDNGRESGTSGTDTSGSKNSGTATTSGNKNSTVQVWSGAKAEDGGIHGYSYTAYGKTYSNTGYKSREEAGNAAFAEINKLTFQGEARESLKYYLRGGLADFTGPAWLDGSRSAPERVLSPTQTSLFETLVASLESMARVTTPAFPSYDGLSGGGTGAVNVGDIIVNVDRMDSDADYEEMADKVFETITTRLNRGAAVGGIRF